MGSFQKKFLIGKRNFGLWVETDEVLRMTLVVQVASTSLATIDLELVSLYTFHLSLSRTDLTFFSLMQISPSLEKIS